MLEIVKITLAAARKNKGLTQAQAAASIGTSLNTLKNWEKGHSYPTQPKIERICEVYGVSYDNLIFLPDKLAKS